MFVSRFCSIRRLDGLSCGHGALKIGIMTLFTDDSSHFEVNTMKFFFVVGMILMILGFLGSRDNLFPRNVNVILVLIFLLGLICVSISGIWWSLI